MPWYAVKFELRDLKNTISNKYGVNGIPHLACMKTNGIMVSNNYRSDVSAKMAEALNSLI